MAKKQIERWKPYDNVYHLGKSALLDELSGSELVVYIRLVGRSSGKERMQVPNRFLHKDASTASRALAGLAERKLVRVKSATRNRRIIEVL